MVKFPSKEWAEAFCRELNNSPEYRSAAAKWEGDIVFAVPGKAAMKFFLKHGVCHGVEYHEEGATVDAPYILEADEKTWLDVIAGKLQPIPAMLLGKIKVKKGSMAVLAQYATAALAMIKTAQKIGVE